MELPEKMLEHFGVKLSSRETTFCVPPGKTNFLAQASANETGAYFLSMRNGPEITGMGKKEDTIFSKFEKDQDNYPSIILNDEIDSLTPRREGDTSEAVKRMVSCLSLKLDTLICTTLPVIVIGGLLEDVKMKLQILNHK